MTIQEKFDLKGKTAVITGGSGLLGAEFCRTMAEAGANVVVADIAEAAAKETAQALVDAGYAATGLALDVTKQDSVNALVDATLKEFGSLDILVNSAALDPKFDAAASSKGIAPGAFENYPLEDFKAAVDVNLTGMFLITQACVKQMVAQGKKGSIINICSTYGLNGPDQRLYLNDDGSRVAFKPVYYTTTKAGVVGFTKYLAAYYAGTEIRVNALTPGGVFNDHNDTFNRKYSEKTIMGRMAHKDEMNGALLFLASEASSYMTGNNVIVDGGWTAW